MERLVLEILAYHKENLISDKRVHDIVLVAIEDSWEAILAHKAVIRNVVELILRDGIETGEFDRVDPVETARVMMIALVAFMHPIVIGQCVEDEDMEANARATVRFLLRAITQRS